MAVISAEKDTQELNFRLVAEFDADVKRVWRIWEDPRQLERWWGPPTWPATFDSYDFAVGGRAAYYMTGPDGEKAHGWWVITGIDAPTRLTFDDGFADENREPMDELGHTHAVVTLEDLGNRTRMTLVTGFESLEQLNQMVEMGMEEGLKLALGQVDSLLAEEDAAV
ncbi:SRPBCC family protein [Arthrobacter agilis]|uniref:SRPBCC family protein n=1 Tax=Arthrobacter agilis TaxID=37921 RepID=UPI00277D584F|nr:SRPBCC domain-containing protein [Arthrobacter agilis]MDQ0736807.1 uncharacterized protein YndB with AHSA1/START domain [Arthrobacter agilis]